MVDIQFTPLLFPYIVSAAVTIWLTIYGVREYETGSRDKTTLAFVGIVLSVSIWTVSRSFELLFADPMLSRFWLTILYIGYGGATMSALFFGLAFSGRTKYLQARYVALLLVIPGIAVLLAATNQFHELLWVAEWGKASELGFETGVWGDIYVLERPYQPTFYAYLVYTVTATVVGLFNLLRTAIGSASIYRRQTAAIILGAISALGMGILFATGLTPFVPEFVDLTPVGFAALGLFFAYAVFRNQLLDIVPVARDTVIEGMRDGYVMLNPNDHIVDLNSTTKEIFDIDEDVIGEPVGRALPHCTEAVAEHEHGTVAEKDIELEGEDRFLTVNISSLYEDEKLVGRLLLLQDITGQRQVKRRYQALIENSSDLIFVVDRDRTVTYASPSVSNVAGVPPEAITGQDIVNLIRDEDRDDLEDLIQELLAKPGEKVRYEYQAMNAEGEWMDFEASLWNLLDNPFVEGFVINAREITERKERERELKRANERLDEFASAVSHDLRNPLNVAYARLDLARHSGDEEDFDQVEDALNRMEDIIEDVLTLAREGQSIGDTEMVSLEDRAEEAWSHVESDVVGMQVANDARFEADPDRILQVFENLFRNADDHAIPDDIDQDGEGQPVAANGGENDPIVTITVGYDDVLYVEDDGPGIPEDERDDVLDTGYTTSREGTGFGLSIVSQVAEAHGWDVEVTESDDGGARFEFHGVTADT